MVFPHSRAQLPAHRLRVLAQQGQIAVGGAAGEQVQHTLIPLQCCEAADQIAVAGDARLAGCLDVAARCFGGDLRVAVRVGLRQKVEALLQSSWGSAA